MLVVINSKFCDYSTNIPLLVYATQSAFLTLLNVSLKMRNFIFGSV